MARRRVVVAKARIDLVSQAFRRLGILAVDEPLTADMAAHGVETYDLLVAELTADGLVLGLPVAGVKVPWAADAVPDGFAMPLAALLSTELAVHYDTPPRDTRARCIARLRSILLPDDREAVELLDDYGIILDEADQPIALDAYY